jgi:hypothetical protein
VLIDLAGGNQHDEPLGRNWRELIGYEQSVGCKGSLR